MNSRKENSNGGERELTLSDADEPEILTDSEQRECLLEVVVWCTRRYVNISPAPQPALVALIDAQLSVLSKDWAMSRAELLECVREPL